MSLTGFTYYATSRVQCSQCGSDCNRLDVNEHGWCRLCVNLDKELSAPVVLPFNYSVPKCIHLDGLAPGQYIDPAPFFCRMCHKVMCHKCKIETADVNEALPSNEQLKACVVKGITLSDLCYRHFNLVARGTIDFYSTLYFKLNNKKLLY